MSATIAVRPNVFEEVVIGTQTWMKRNYDFGGSYPGNDIDNITEYGKLYTWAEAMAIDVDGWHLPTKTEIETLSTYLGGDSYSGGKMKEGGTTHWTTPNTGADNSSGFTLVGAGWNEGFLKQYCFVWTSNELVGDNTRVVSLAMSYDSESSYQAGLLKTDRATVRLIKN
jgi:uncharacterized protein (TIGR02145 family)